MRSTVDEEVEEQQTNEEGSSSRGGGDLAQEGSSSTVAVVQRRKKINYQEVPSDEDMDSEEERVIKKQKMEKKKQVPEWKDLKQVSWEEGDEPLGRLPNEILDLVISADSDLDVSKHLSVFLRAERWIGRAGKVDAGGIASRELELEADLSSSSLLL